MSTKQPAVVVVLRSNRQSPLSPLRPPLARGISLDVSFCKSFDPSGAPFYKYFERFEKVLLYTSISCFHQGPEGGQPSGN